VALNWLVDNYARIAEWLASAGRVAGLWTAFSDLDASVGTGGEERITIEESTDENIHLDSLAVAQHNGKVMIDEADTTNYHKKIGVTHDGVKSIGGPGIADDDELNAAL
jgi:ABC-type uncharacterized transport system fused permease/ATPase subunit